MIAHLGLIHQPYDRAIFRVPFFLPLIYARLTGLPTTDGMWNVYQQNNRQASDLVEEQRVSYLLYGNSTGRKIFRR